jgi:hypothetical protein
MTLVRMTPMKMTTCLGEMQPQNSVERTTMTILMGRTAPLVSWLQGAEAGSIEGDPMLEEDPNNRIRTRAEAMMMDLVTSTAAGWQ